MAVLRAAQNGGDGQMTPLLRLSAGAVAGIIGMSATYPLDMVRGRLTIQVPPPPPPPPLSRASTPCAGTERARCRLQGSRLTFQVSPPQPPHIPGASPHMHSPHARAWDVHDAGYRAASSHSRCLLPQASTPARVWDVHVAGLQDTGRHQCCPAGEGAGVTAFHDISVLSSDDLHGKITVVFVKSPFTFTPPVSLTTCQSAAAVLVRGCVAASVCDAAAAVSKPLLWPRAHGRVGHLLKGGPPAQGWATCSRVPFGPDRLPGVGAGGQGAGPVPRHHACHGHHHP